jgi:hypothetical protein
MWKWTSLILAVSLAVAIFNINQGHLATDHLCGLVTGVPEYEYTSGILYCRDKNGNLQKPIKIKYHFEKLNKAGVQTYNYVPRRECLLGKNS